jgi:methyl-accepting chemotaxis protein-1 (serine sensor receptor)
VTRLEDNLQQVMSLVGNLCSLLNDISVATLSQGEMKLMRNPGCEVCGD